MNRRRERVESLMDIPEEAWKIEGWCHKSNLWTSLKWLPMYTEDEVGEKFSTKSICFQVQLVPKPDYCCWFSISINDLLTKSEGPRPMFWSAEDEILRTAVGFSPNKIYAFGGSSRIPKDANNVLCYDITRPDDGWLPLPRMRTPRARPSSIVIGNQIYVFGGRLIQPGIPYAEKFNPETDEQWKSLDDFDFPEENIPYRMISNTNCLLVDTESQKHLLLHSCRVDGEVAIYTCNLNDGSIHLAERPFPELDHRAVVTVDGVLYSYLVYTKNVRGYDLVNKEWYPGHVGGLESLTGNSGNSTTFHLLNIGAKRMCLIRGDVTDDLKLQLKCLVFTVRKVKDSGGEEARTELVADVVCERSYLVPRTCILWDCIIT